MTRTSKNDCTLPTTGPSLHKSIRRRAHSHSKPIFTAHPLMLDDWDENKNHRILLKACILTGTPLSFVRDNLAVKGTGVSVLPKDEFRAIRANKWRNLQKQLGRFQAGLSDNQKPKRPGALSTTYEVVPCHFKFSDIVELKADSTEKLPVFTIEHYKRQFNTPPPPPRTCPGESAQL